ncbi:hypothetical protein QCW_3399 [Clostridioides difficile CD69]|nr:hypothetical protein QCW_3399 [Clostridioides difficile CD69]
MSFYKKSTESGFILTIWNVNLSENSLIRIARGMFYINYMECKLQM